MSIPLTTAELVELVTRYTQRLLFPTEVTVFVRFDGLIGNFSYVRIKEDMLTDYNDEFRKILKNYQYREYHGIRNIVVPPLTPLERLRVTAEQIENEQLPDYSPTWRVSS